METDSGIFVLGALAIPLWAKIAGTFAGGVFFAGAFRGCTHEAANDK